MEKFELLQYLQTVLDVEKNVYTLQEASFLTQRRIKDLPASFYVRPMKEIEKENREGTKKVIQKMKDTLLAVPFFIFTGVLLGKIAAHFLSGTGAAITIGIIYWAVGLLAAGGIWDCADSLQKNKKQSQKNLAAHKKQQIKEVLQTNLGLLRDQLSEEKAILRKLYSLNILSPKYRNMVAVATFLEYLEAGRCSKLEGHEGAYNLFENEQRLSLIITNQQEIIRRLDEIKETQYQICRMLESSMEEIQTMCSVLQESNEKLDANLQTNQIIAYHSQVTAENTQFTNSYLIWKDLLES